jgi:predicted nucleic acid-binding protein
MKLPDAVIAATAIHLKLPLLTAETDFQNIDKLMLYLYKTE